MKLERTEWQRLIEAARRAPDQRDPNAPYGFATRIAAQAVALERMPATAWLFERMSLRALGFAALLVVATVATNVSPIKRMIEEDAAALYDDPVIELSDLS
jgi:hypothetical protein